jgi:hypothetical protein
VTLEQLSTVYPYYYDSTTVEKELDVVEEERKQENV